MKEILFRGKRVDNKEWDYGYYMQDGLSNHYIIELKNKADKDYDYGKTYRYIEVIPETIGQYTGLEDKNGKKIFEGDIVYEGCNGFEAPVVYDKKLGTYRLDGLGEDYIIKDAPIEWEVIGNVFDEKE